MNTQGSVQPHHKQNPSRDHIKINLTGDFSKKINLQFEAYRQAVSLNLSGYVKKKDETHTEILLAGERDAARKFLDWLKIRISEMKIRMLTERPDVRIEYKEFRIIHNNVERG